MSTTRDAEADTASAAYHAALTRLGVSTVQEALTLWQRVPALRTETLTTVWLRASVQMILTRRSIARDLAMAYYRLVRALRTGHTILDPQHPDSSDVTLGQLRRDFVVLTTPTGSSDTPAAPDDAERIPVEQVENLDREQLERQERAAAREAQDVLDQLGPRNLDRKTGRLDLAAPAVQVDAERREAHRQAGARQAAAAERITMNGARSTVWAAAQNDRRALGWIRVSTTGTPCGWCAMLLSRGAAYKSRRGAEYADGDKYHDNCHCIAEPVWTEQQAASDRYALNQQYAGQWPEVTRGLSGKAAVSAWRRFIRQQQATADRGRPAPSAQEASAP